MLWGLHVCVPVGIFVDVVSKQGAQHTAREALMTPSIAMGREKHGVPMVDSWVGWSVKLVLVEGSSTLG